MAKEKVQQIDVKDNERLFHYEILGIIILVLSIFAIAKMGLVGEYLMLIVKLLFGDWYFLIFLLLIAYAIRCIIFHTRLKIGNIRYLGVFLIILSLILLSHFSMHKYIKNYDENSLVLTLKLYLNAFKINSPGSIVGGGIIGCIFFYLSYYLLSEFGVILLSILFIFLGIVFICKKTIRDFIEDIIYFLKNVYLIYKKIRSKLKNNVDLYDKSYKKNKIRFKISKIDSNQYYKQELEISKRNVEIIKKTLNGMNVFYNEISYLICRNITVYFIDSHYKYSFDVFYRNLSKYLHHILFKIDENDGNLIVEINNLNPVPLRINEIVQNDSEVIIGIDDRNNFLKLNSKENKLVVFSKNKQSLTDYLDSIVLSIMHYKAKIKLHFIDLLSLSYLSTANDIDELDSLIYSINEKIKLFNRDNVSSIDEYNKKNIKKLQYELIIINGININTINNQILEKLFYIIETTKNFGYYFIFSSNDGSNMFNDLFNQFDYKLFKDETGEYSNLCLNNIDYSILSNECEGFLLYKSIVIRMCLLLLTDYEKENIK